MSWKIKTIYSFIKNNWAETVLAILVISYIVIFSYLSIRRHLAFASSYDLANMDQTIWNTLHGKFFSLTSSNGYISRLGLHADLILILLAPFYLIYDSVKTLLVLQSIFIALAAIPIYLLTKDILKSKFKGLIMATVFLINPGVQWTNIYDFHGVSMAMFFLLSAFYCTYMKKWNWVYFYAFMALLTKESVSLAVIMLGLYIFMVSKERIKGAWITLVGVIWFITFVFFLIPHFALTGRYWVWDWFKLSDYTEPGVGRGKVDFAVIVNKIFGGEAIHYYSLLLKPYVFLPLLGLPWFFISLPDLLINLASTQGQMRSIVFHYGSVSTVGLVLASILGWKIIEKVFKKFKYVGWLVGILILAAALRTNYHYGPLPTTPSYWRPMYEVGPDEIAFKKVLRALPKEFSITASSEVRPHVAHRPFAYNLPAMTDKADYIAIVDQNRIVGDYNPKEFETKLIKELLVDPNMELTFHQGHFYLFKRK